MISCGKIHPANHHGCLDWQCPATGQALPRIGSPVEADAGCDYPPVSSTSSGARSSFCWGEERCEGRWRFHGPGHCQNSQRGSMGSEGSQSIFVLHAKSCSSRSCSPPFEVKSPCSTLLGNVPECQKCSFGVVHAQVGEGVFQAYAGVFDGHGKPLAAPRRLHQLTTVVLLHRGGNGGTLRWHHHPWSRPRGRSGPSRRPQRCLTTVCFSRQGFKS